MWSTRNARWPHAVFNRLTMRAPAPARSGRPAPVAPVRGRSDVARGCGRTAGCGCSTRRGPARPNPLGVPELSSQMSATARRCSSSACAAILARASSSDIPRCSTSRRNRTSTSACTMTTSGNSGAIPGFHQQRNVFDDNGIFGHRRDDLRAALAHQRVNDPVEPSGVPRRREKPWRPRPDGPVLRREAGCRHRTPRPATPVPRCRARPPRGRSRRRRR